MSQILADMQAGFRFPALQPNLEKALQTSSTALTPVRLT